jgi:hypothetical protein
MYGKAGDLSMSALLANWKLALVGLLLAALGVQTVRIAGLKQEAAEQRASLATATQRAEHEQREIEAQRAAAITEVQTHAQSQINALAADLVASRTAADGLRAAAASAARRARQNPAVAGAGPSEPGSDSLDLLVGVLERHSAELVEVGEFADRARIAGMACERAYDGLTR